MGCFLFACNQQPDMGAPFDASPAYACATQFAQTLKYGTEALIFMGMESLLRPGCTLCELRLDRVAVVCAAGAWRLSVLEHRAAQRSPHSLPVAGFECPANTTILQKLFNGTFH